MFGLASLTEAFLSVLIRFDFVNTDAIDAPTTYLEK